MMINKRLINLCDESKKYIKFTILANWVASLCNILIILFIGSFINLLFKMDMLSEFKISGLKEIFNYKILGNLNLKIAIFIIIALLIIKFICNIYSTKFSSLASAKARIKLREVLFKKLLKLGVNYDEVESTSALVQISTEGIEQLEVYFGRYLPQFFYALITPVTLFIFMSFISIKVALVFILCVPLIPISIILIMKIAKRILKEYWNSYSNLGETFLENLQGLTTLKVFRMDKYRHKKMNNEAENFRKITMRVLRMQLNSITIMDVIAFGGAALGIIVALFQFINGEILLGSLVFIILLSSEFFIPLRLLGSYFHIAMNGMAASERIFNILDAEVKEKVIEKDFYINKEVEVEVSNVDFSYDGKRKVLSNINLEILKNRITAIVGESGSGKSTIANIILNNYLVNKGTVLINKTNIDNVALDEIYSNIAVISTNSYIFNGTILDNLLIGKKDASEIEIREALRKARLSEFVDELKDGLQTNVGQAGSNLSGGQKQRLALARAILSDKKMFIFDEATSNIDIESEEAIWESIYEISKSKTILVISHRLANVKNASKIYVLKNGEIVESGKHNELLDKKNVYYNMVKNQNDLELVRQVN